MFWFGRTHKRGVSLLRGMSKWQSLLNGGPLLRVRSRVSRLDFRTGVAFDVGINLTLDSSDGFIELDMCA